MKSYTNQNPEFTETFEVMEPTDTNHADNVNATTQPLIDNTLFLKEKMDGMTVDEELSATSENPVQNKVVKAAIDAKGAPVIISDTAPSDINALWVKPGGST